MSSWSQPTLYRAESGVPCASACVARFASATLWPVLRTRDEGSRLDSAPASEAQRARPCSILRSSSARLRGEGELHRLRPDRDRDQRWTFPCVSTQSLETSRAGPGGAEVPALQAGLRRAGRAARGRRGGGDAGASSAGSAALGVLALGSPLLAWLVAARLDAGDQVSARQLATLRRENHE